MSPNDISYLDWIQKVIPSKNIRNSSSFPIRWDAHGCPPFEIGSDLSFLKRYKSSGVDFISLNVGFDLTSQEETLAIINYFHQWVQGHNDEYAIVESVNQIYETRMKNRLSIAFDIEGCNVLNNNLEMVDTFYKLGVKQMLFAYNNNNSAGGGCFDNDLGLSKFGKQLVKKCNEIGMVVDCSHLGYRTSMEIMELSSYPIVFSHSNPRGLLHHPRNILDEQIIACAEKKGVIGINGVGIFLGDNDVRSETIVEHIDYIAQKVGAEYVGIGLDCLFAPEEIKVYVKNNPSYFPVEQDIAIAQPEQFSEIGCLLKTRGYSEDDINNILGENFLRVAKAVWK
ncbi:MAG: dipeptidase [Gammaproteobacteria bacterium]